jgi:hypothetical protein
MTSFKQSEERIRNYSTDTHTHKEKDLKNKNK